MRTFSLILFTVGILQVMSCRQSRNAQAVSQYSKPVERVYLDVQAQDSVVNAEYQQLHAKLDRKPKYTEWKTSLESVHAAYQQIWTLLRTTEQDFKEKVAIINETTGEIRNKAELVANHAYWFGPNPESNLGRGDGKAFALRQEMDRFHQNIMIVNEKWNINSENGQIFTPQALKDTVFNQEKLSWEQYTFDAPLVANLAILEALKLDVNETMLQEMHWMRKRFGIAQ